MYLGGVPYQTVTVPLRAPVTIAWVMLGFPIDDALATHLQSSPASRCRSCGSMARRRR